MYKLLHIPTAQYIYMYQGRTSNSPLYYLEREAKKSGLYEKSEKNEWTLLLFNSRKDFKAMTTYFKDKLCMNIQEDLKGSPLKSDPVTVTEFEFELIELGDDRNVI